MIGEAVKIWKQGRPGDAAKRDELMRLWTEAEVLRLTNIRASSCARWATRARGLDRQAMSRPSSTSRSPSSPSSTCSAPRGCSSPTATRWPADPRHEWANAQQAFLRTRANSIEGGTTEIAKNILGERGSACRATSGSTRTSPGRLPRRRPPRAAAPGARRGGRPPPATPPPPPRPPPGPQGPPAVADRKMGTTPTPPPGPGPRTEGERETKKGAGGEDRAEPPSRLGGRAPPAGGGGGVDRSPLARWLMLLSR